MNKGQLLLGLGFGIIFGFLLQKGGVAKFDVLIGMLLLENFTVAKVMLTAILVGMVSVYLCHRLGLVRLHVKPTRLGGNVVGGLIFGVGFALAAYCPGTGAAALGQGNLDALAMMLGMVAGAYLFAALPAVAKDLQRRGDYGEVTWPGVLRLGRGASVALLTAVVGLGLFGLSALPPG